jgi:uncharacterized protein Yka (UPF0111/DUF47 family)
MPDDIFRIVITVAVALAALAVVAQAAAMMALYRAVRKMQRKTEPLVDRVQPLMVQIGPAIGKIQEMMEKAGPVIEKIGPVLDKAGPAFDRSGPVIERAGKVLETTQQILDETRPKIRELTAEVVGIAKAGRQQVEGVGEFLQEAGDRARTRLEQIDQSVDSTVEHVEQVGDAMKRAVLRPVREVNGIAAGISAVLSTLVRGRKSSVDHATQDEEMFI